MNIAYEGLKGSLKLGKQQRKVLVGSTNLSESQIDRWVEAKHQEKDSADFIPAEALKAVASRKGRGVVASKVPSMEDVEVVDILDEEEDLVELSLEETPGRGSSNKANDDVKLTMVRNQTSSTKSPYSLLPKAVLSKSSAIKAQAKSKAAVNDQGDMEELMTRVEQLETALRDKDAEIEAMNKEAAGKEDARAQLLDMEHALNESEKKIKAADVKMSKMSEENKKTLAKKVEDELKRKLKEQSDQKDKMETLQRENVKLKSRVEETKLIKDDESKVLKAEIKTLKADMKKAVFSKEEEVKTLKAEVKSLKTDDKKQFELEKERELEAKDEQMKAEIRAQETDFKEKLELKCKEVKLQLDQRDKQLQDVVAAKTEEFNTSLKQKEDQFNQELEVSQLQILTKEQELLRLRGQSVEMEKAMQAGKQAINESASLKKQLAAQQIKLADGKKEVLDLKSYQRKLESKINLMEEEVMISKAGAETQVISINIICIYIYIITGEGEAWLGGEASGEGEGTGREGERLRPATGREEGA